MDSIRAAFGVSKINYYAFSYGTYLGQVYATLFPARVRRMVLDSTVDPTGVWYSDNIEQDYAFQGRYRRVLLLGRAERQQPITSGTTPARRAGRL